MRYCSADELESQSTHTFTRARQWAANVMVLGLAEEWEPSHTRDLSLTRGRPTTKPQSRVCSRPQLPCILSAGFLVRR